MTLTDEPKRGIMEDTNDILNGIERNYRTSYDTEKYAHWTTNDLITLSQNKMAEAIKLTVEPTPLISAIQAARLYGLCAQIGKNYKLGNLELDAHSRYAQLLAWVVVPKRDEARRKASGEFFSISEQLSLPEENEYKAISLTNGALCLLELNNPTKAELTHAKEVCERTIQMRAKGTVDFAYSQMNLSLAERKFAPFSAEPHKERIYDNIIRGLDRGLKVFESTKQASSDVKAIYHHNILETLTDWLAYETEQIRVQQYDACVPNHITQEDKYGLSDFNYCNALKANPAVLGYEAEPDWLPSEESILNSAIKKIKGLSSRVSRVKKFITRSNKNHSRLEIRLFEIETTFSQLTGIPEVPTDALDDLWKSGDLEQFFISARNIVMWKDSDLSIDREEYLVILLRISQCLRLFRLTWTVEEINALFSRNPYTFRMAACRLAGYGKWEEAFLLLEASRGIVSSNSYTELPAHQDEDPKEVSWIHVTHSPEATYLVCLSQGEYSGTIFKDLSGRFLTSIFLSFTHGLLSMSQFDRSLAISSTNAISECLSAIGNWISLLPTRNIVLLPGGYYQSFPVWSCGELRNQVISCNKVVFSAPSRTLALSTVEQEGLAMISNASVQDASSIPGKELKWSRQESSVLTSALSSLSVETHAASFESFSVALQKKDIVHFTGHSGASLDPQDSSLQTYGNHVTVRDLLAMENSSFLVSLGSCESGLSRNAIQQDEMLSIQSAIFYSGVPWVIGTYWPISDPEGFAFTTKFYAEFARLTKEGCSPLGTTISKSFSVAINWMKSASVSAITALGINSGVDISQSGSQLLAFNEFDWSSFYVIGLP